MLFQSKLRHLERTLDLLVPGKSIPARQNFQAHFRGGNKSVVSNYRCIKIMTATSGVLELPPLAMDLILVDDLSLWLQELKYYFPYS